jgi:hypothetical protein
MSMQYLVDVEPHRGVVGAPVTAMLRCRAYGMSAGILTFEHRSLVLELDGTHLPEPYLAFPNRFAVEEGETLIRMSAPGGIEDLEDGEERVRTFDLVALFPDAVLDPGRLLFTYRLEEAEPPVRPEPAAIELQSGPEAVPLLIQCLNSPSDAVRFRASVLLQQMTAQEWSTPAEWSEWWTKYGNRLPWDYDSDGAVLNAGAPTPARPLGRSGRLGGVAYPASSTETS